MEVLSTAWIVMAVLRSKAAIAIDLAVHPLTTISLHTGLLALEAHRKEKKAKAPKIKQTLNIHKAARMRPSLSKVVSPFGGEEFSEMDC